MRVNAGPGFCRRRSGNINCLEDVPRPTAGTGKALIEVRAESRFGHPRLDSGSPSIYGELCTINETGTLRRQEDNCLGNLVGCGWTARRSLGSYYSCARPSPIASVPSVSVGPGLTALTRTPRGPYSAAHVLVNRLMAALLEP
jgi:hypothetical protein